MDKNKFYCVCPGIHYTDRNRSFGSKTRLYQQKQGTFNIANLITIFSSIQRKASENLIDSIELAYLNDVALFFP